jgi:small-conductance mechanosensitive channel
MEQVGKSARMVFEDFGSPILATVIAIIIAFVIYKLICHGINRLSRKGIIPNQLRSTMQPIIKWLIVIITTLLAFGFFGVSVTTFWATLSGVLVLVAIGFVAVWSVLSNILCSILLVIFAPFRIGDEIEIQDPAAPITLRGKVTGINMFFTTLEDGDSSSSDDTSPIIRVPNNLFFQKYVRRWPGTGTQSLKSYLAHEHQRAED